MAVVEELREISEMLGEIGDQAAALADRLSEPSPGDIPLYGQRDARWALERLGGGQTTIGRYGCVITCLAMAASAETGREITPSYVNAGMQAIGGYTGENRNLVVWRKVPKALPCLSYKGVVWCRWDPAPLDRINDTLRRGGYVLAKVDFQPGGDINSHYVLLVREVGGGYLIHDPWTGKAHEFPPAYCRAGWTAARGIFALAFFEGGG